MEEWLRGYVLTVMGASVIALVVDCIVPEGTIRRFARFGTSLVVCAAMLMPFASLPSLADTASLSQAPTFVPDYTEAVTRTVHAVPGYENARVYVETQDGAICAIVISTGGKLIEEASSALTRRYLTDTLSALFGTDRITVEDGT